MKKILFLIHDLGGGGAEKVLVNLVNHLDRTQFEVTLMSLFDVGVNRQRIAPHVHYKSCFRHMVPGNSHFMKLLTPKQLHKWLIRDEYDVEISYLEGPSARVISGCTNRGTKLVSWIHVEQHTRKIAAFSFRSVREAERCYGRFDRHIFVAETVKNDFLSLFPQSCPCLVLYNTVESDTIIEQAKEPTDRINNNGDAQLIAIGTLKASKGFARLLRVVARLKDEGYELRLYLLGNGPLREELEEFVTAHNLRNTVYFLGYDMNPYKYLSKCGLFVCSSHAEGFSTAATEALIVGTPVCTVEVSGMKEMLGANNEYGIVTENSEEGLYKGIKGLLDSPAMLEHYKKQAEIRGKTFSTESTVRAVEDMINSL